MGLYSLKDALGSRSGGIAARANGSLFRFGFFRLFRLRLFCFLSHSVLLRLQGGRFGEAGLRPHTIVESPDSVGLSAKEPMNLVDKRLDKATAPRLLWGP